jgi:hypothetical protein
MLHANRCYVGRRLRILFFNRLLPLLCPPCLRYVSEKLWNPFRAGTVPIYVGGHAEARQGRWLPEHSWIDASEFGSVRELAEHLVFLSKRPDE